MVLHNLDTQHLPNLISIHVHIELYLSYLHECLLQNLVEKVKNWLAPSSWLSYLSPSKDGQSSGPRNGPLPPQDSLPTATADRHQRLPSDMTSQYEGPSNQPMPPPSATVTSTASKLFSPGTRMSTANYRAALSLFEEALGDTHPSNDPTSPCYTNNPADSSNESFVEEETGPEETTDTPRGLSDMDMQTGSQSTEQKFASNESQSTSIARVHSPAQVEGTEVQECTVQMVSNPAFSNKVTPSHRRTFIISPKVNTGLSAELTRRLYSPAATIPTSTPQLSPVHERQEESVSIALGLGVIAPSNVECFVCPLFL